VVTLGDLAALLEARLEGGARELQVDGIAPLPRASATQLAFLAEHKYLPALRETRAACVLLREDMAAHSPVPVLCVDDPYLAYARASRLFEVGSGVAPGVHPSAVVDASARVPASARIGAHATIGADVELGENVTIGPGCCLGPRVRLGAGCELMAQVSLYHDVVVGDRCRIHANTVIGADGFGFARSPAGWVRISQLGSVVIGDDVDIGASVTIDRGALEDTVIEDGVIIDDQVHIGHNCRIGARSAIAGCTGIAGSVTVGTDCTMAGQVGVSGHLEICDNVHLTGQARVTRSVTEPGSYSSGTPLEPTRPWARNAVRFTQLEALQRRVQALEAALQALRGSDVDGDPSA
jgi:UDP-3-O-[3-hydroxymyristoyl] glucosamine N-acyltransferase